MIEPSAKSSPEVLTIATQATAPAKEVQFLRLLLIPDTTIAISVQYLMEILTVSVQKIVPIPHMPPWVMGVYNWRGEVLWMVDLGHLFGLTPWYQLPLNRSEFSALVLRQRQPGSEEQEGPILGLVVHEVDDIEWFNSVDIKPLPASLIAPGIAPFVQGCWWKASGDMLTVVDGTAIFQAMPAPTSAPPIDSMPPAAIESPYYPDMRRAT